MLQNHHITWWSCTCTLISLRNFGSRTPAKGGLGTCRSVFPREFSRNWQKMCTPHFLQLWLFNAPLSLRLSWLLLKPVEALRMQINLGSFICSLCSVVCSIILQRLLGLFLLQNLYLQPFVQSAEFKIHESALEPCGHRWTVSFRCSLYYKHMEFHHLFPHICFRKSCDLLFTQTATTAQSHRISLRLYIQLT